MEYSGPNMIFLKALLEKRYALPSKALQYLMEYFLRFQDDPRSLPVIWHQTLLVFAQIYASKRSFLLYNFQSYFNTVENLDEMQKEALKLLVKKKTHHLISKEILDTIDNKNKQETVKKNLNKSLHTDTAMSEEPQHSRGEKMVLE